MIQIIPHSKLWLTIAGLVFLLSVIGFLTVGLRYGIDFTGGSLLEVEFSATRPSVAELQTLLKPLNLNPTVQPLGEKGVLLRVPELSEDMHQKTFDALKTYDAKILEKRFESVGPTLGRELAQRTIWAIILGCLLIIAYVAFAFRNVSRPVASWKYGVLAVVGLVHDVAFLVGVFVVLGAVFGTEITSTFVAALLTTLGYSVNDTIVIFDRIRERIPRSTDSFGATVNRSLNETMARSLFTTLTTIFVILPVYFFGGTSVKDFALALMVGIGVGAYSSIFVASPLLVLWQGGSRRK